MVQRIYIDTSVFGGHFDEEFKEHTIPLFDRIKAGEFIILYSTVTQDELENAPEKVKEQITSWKEGRAVIIENTHVEYSEDGVHLRLPLTLIIEVAAHLVLLV